MDSIDFKSSKETEKERQWEKEARQAILDKAKNEYERRQAKEEAARQRGENTWMLPSVEAKLCSEKSSKKKKKKEKKKKKKSKKSKKKNSSSSSSDSEAEESWIEKSSSIVDNSGSSSQTVQDHNNDAVQQPTRDGWMEMTSLFGTYSREEMHIRDGTSRKVAKEVEERKKKETEKPGSHALELNPYYKDGGSGLPEEKQKSSDRSGVAESVGSSNFDAAWLRRALKRAQEQSKEQGKSLEEVAAQRWGSLEKFYELLDEAEGKGKASKIENRQKNRSISRDKRSRSKERGSRCRDKRSRSRDRSSSRDRRRHSRSRSKGRRRCSRSRSKERKQLTRSRSRDMERSRSRETKKNKKRSRSRSKEGRSDRSSERRNKNRRNRSSSSSSSSSRSRSRSKSREKYSSSRSKCKGLGLMKPLNDMNPTSYTSMFKKPGEEDTVSSKWKGAMGCSSSSNRGWQKKEFRPSASQAQEKEQRSSSASSSSSDSEDEKKSTEECEQKNSMHISELKITETVLEKSPAPAPTPIFLNDKQMNELGAKIIKAEMLGNDSQVAKLKAKMEAARAARASGAAPSIVEGESGSKEEVVLLTKTDGKGNVCPVSIAESEEYNKKKRNKVKTHGKDGKRERYFPDDDKYNLKEMFAKEKGTSAEDQISLFENEIAKNHERLTDDYDIDDMFMDKAAQRLGDTEKQKEMERQKAIKEHQRTQRSLENCQWCFDSKESLKHLIVALGSKTYLSLPAHESLTPGHCIIVPIQHTTCAVQADEDLWSEVQLFRKSLVRLFESRGEDTIFFEMARGFRNLPHMSIHCIPLPKETGDMAPIYFKKAIMECEGEWSQNKKLVELKGRDVRRAIPKGLPYFFVDFAMNDGYAHVIEDEQIFPRNFAQEIVGGMLDLETNVWRKPRRENFDAQRRKVMQFSTWYKEFDPTHK